MGARPRDVALAGHVLSVGPEPAVARRGVRDVSEKSSAQGSPGSGHEVPGTRPIPTRLRIGAEHHRRETDLCPGAVEVVRSRVAQRAGAAAFACSGPSLTTASILRCASLACCCAASREAEERGGPSEVDPNAAYDAGCAGRPCSARKAERSAGRGLVKRSCRSSSGCGNASCAACRNWRSRFSGLSRPPYWTSPATG